jgi:signal transduction histidine kinase
MRQNSIKARVLLPFALALGVLLIALILNVFHDQYDRLSEDVEMRLESVQELFDKQIQSETEHLDAVITVLSQNLELQAAWLAQDREKLLQLSEPLLTDLSNRLKITHFYYHDANRINFLRVYHPERFGDVIKRQTLLEAERTGKPSVGIELGKLGTLTLRMVHPWIIDGQLAGYIEMGEEIDHLIRKLRDILQVELYVSIYKEFLNRKDWESGMKLMGMQSNWDQYPASVIVGKTHTEIPGVLGSFLVKGEHEYMEMARDLKLSFGNMKFRVGVIPLFDVSEREVGDIVVLYNVTEQVRATRKVIAMTLVICLSIGLALFVLFFRILGNVDKELTQHRHNLEELVGERTNELIETNKHLNLEIDERVKAEQELQKIRDNLEEMVEERTAQLASTYEQLQVEAIEKNQLIEQAAVAEERSRLARDLHDSLTQSLYSFSLFIQTAKELVENGDKQSLKNTLAELTNASKDVHKELRLLVYNLRPSVLEDEGLVGALRQRLDTVEGRAGIITELITEGECRLSLQGEETVYRVIQELLNNILQHSSATEVSLKASFGEEQSYFTVQDNGIGFDPENTNGRTGLGLVIMRERVEKIGGQLSIMSKPGKGTTVIITVNNS